MAVAMLMTGCVSNIKDGVSLLEAGKYEEAINVFQLEIQEEKNLAEANRGVGLAYFELGDYEQATLYFEKALVNEAKETASLYHLMGTCYMYCENYEGAVSSFDKALLLEDCTETMKQEMMLNKIVAYEKMMDWESARVAADNYLQAYPNDEAVKTEAEFLATR